MESLSEELQNLIVQIASRNNIANYTVEINKGVANEGDGYIGILEGLSVIDKDSDRKLSLVIKRAPANENLRKQFPTRACFLREICIYDKVIPEFLKFQEEYNIPNPFNSTTQLYGYVTDELKEILLLANLKTQGYKLCNRQEPMDSHHLSLVITEYARWHALSHAMRRLKPELFEKVTEDIRTFPIMDRGQPPQESGKGDSFFGPTMEALKNKPKELEAIKKFKESCFQFMFVEVQKKDENCVVAHADCWSANMMFKYEDEDRPQVPTKLCLIDWQMAMLSSPIHDLSYFLCLCAGKKDLDNYMRYLHLYHTALCENLAAFGLDPEEICPFEFLEAQWQKYAKIGFFMSLIMLQQSLSEKKTHDFEQNAKDGKSIFDLGDRMKNISDLFKQRMCDLVEFLVEHNII